MKRLTIFAGLLILSGCTSATPVKDIIHDPQFTDYKRSMDQLEKDYLHKKITYAQYLERKKHAEQEYQKEAETRRDLIESSDQTGTGTGPELGQ